MPDQRRAILIAHPSADLYGSDRMVLETVDALRRAGRPVIVTIPAAGPLVAELEAHGASVVLCPSPVVRKAALRPRGFVALVGELVRGVRPGWRLVRRRDVAAVYVNTVTVPLWLLLARLARRPTLGHVHEAERSARPLVRRVLVAPLALAQRIVANSEFSKAVVADSFASLGRRTDVVYNAVAGPEQPATEPRPTLSDPVRLVFLGRLSPRKGPDVAVDALAELVGSGLDARLDLVGAVFPGYEWFEAQLHAQAERRGVADRVAFRGFHPDPWPFLAAADIVLVPSTVDEPFGNIAVEAALAARPSVVSSSGGLSEAARAFEAAVVVAPKSVAEMVAGVRQIVDGWPAFRARATQDARRAQELFGAPRYQQHIVELVEELSR